MRNITLAGKTYEVRYGFEEKQLILEAMPEQPGLDRNLLMAMTKVELPRFHATVIWAGIRGARRKTEMTTDSVLQAMGEHNEQGGWYDADVLVPCWEEVLDSKLMGKGVNAAGIKAVLRRNVEQINEAEREMGKAVVPAE